MAFVEALAPFFVDFGESGTLNGQAVRVIFDAQADELLGGGIVAQQPQVHIATASVPANPEGLLLVLPQGTFSVRTHLPDGTGLSVLHLTRA